MHGRLTSDDAPSRNEWGVSYRTLYESEKAASARLIAKYRVAIELFLRAFSMDPNHRHRAKLLKEAKAHAEFLLR